MNELLKELGFDPQKTEIIPFMSEEDHSTYQVWKIIDGTKNYVLKFAKEKEAEIYQFFLKELEESVPKLYQLHHYNNCTYLLMEYIEGTSLTKGTTDAVTKALDALISIQKQTWNQNTSADRGFTFSQSLIHRHNRKDYLNDSELEQIYDEFLNLYQTLPRALCHDDLLPFNIIVNAKKAVLIDWETAGILPYPVSLARLIAHGEEDENAFFYLSKKDKAYALQYYYDHFIQDKGISKQDYEITMQYFIFYEYCEWIMLGNKYTDADPIRYKKYFKLAKELANTIKTA